MALTAVPSAAHVVALTGSISMDTKDDAHRQRAGEVWRCEDCGDMADPLSSEWRWTGECWQHHHGLAGHIDAKRFGEDPATVRVPREPTETMLRAAMPWLKAWQHMRATDRNGALSAAYKAMLSAAGAER